jgi:hypothetical protein
MSSGQLKITNSDPSDVDFLAIEPSDPTDASHGAIANMIAPAVRLGLPRLLFAVQSVIDELGADAAQVADLLASRR